jgi:hypothetical protein
VVLRFPDVMFHHHLGQALRVGHTSLFQPPADEVVRIETTNVGPRQNAETIYEMLLSRGSRPPNR